MTSKKVERARTHNARLVDGAELKWMPCFALFYYKGASSLRAVHQTLALAIWEPDRVSLQWNPRSATRLFDEPGSFSDSPGRIWHPSCDVANVFDFPSVSTCFLSTISRNRREPAQTPFLHSIERTPWLAGSLSSARPASRRISATFWRSPQAQLFSTAWLYSRALLVLLRLNAF